MATKTSEASPDKRHTCDSAFKAEALRLTNESRSTQAAAGELGISPELLYRWQQAQVVADIHKTSQAQGKPQPGLLRIS